MDCNEIYQCEINRLNDPYQAWINLSDECKNYISKPLYKSKTSIRRNKRIYKNLCWRLTELNAKSMPDIHKRDFKSFHIDHIVPISFGFKYNINPHLISSIENLRIINADSNLDKGIKLTKDSIFILLKWNISI